MSVPLVRQQSRRTCCQYMVVINWMQKVYLYLQQATSQYEVKKCTVIISLELISVKNIHI